MKLAAVDFETHAIGPWPDDAPKPVGVAIMIEGRKPEYHAWGHPSGNNSTIECARERLKDIYSRFEIVEHNTGFDLEVAFRHLGLSYPERFHDSQLLAFLSDPGAKSLGLKETADRVLSTPPAERDTLRDLILDRIPEAARKPSQWPKFICEMPGDLVTPYAIGDVTRTLDLFAHLHPKIVEDDMLPAYKRELAQIPILAEMTRRGVPIARNRLTTAIAEWEVGLDDVERAIRLELDSPALNLNSGAQLADALADAGKVTEFRRTEKGNPSVSREALAATIADAGLRDLFAKWTAVNTNLRFARPLLKLSSADGRIHCRWNSTPHEKVGARTGRTVSNKPNLQGIAATMRQFIAPEPGAILIERDYSQQELRVLAHYENADIKAAYLVDPHTDFHTLVAERASQILGRELSRKDAKEVVFASLYGIGIALLATKLGCSPEEARIIRNAVFVAAPGVAATKRWMERARWFETWGGRKYVADPDATYKSLNYLIQGSAADFTKTATVRAAAAGLDLRLTVHDAFVIMSEPGAHLRRDMAALREAMEGIEFDIPMLSDGKWSEKNWGAMRKYRD